MAHLPAEVRERDEHEADANVQVDAILRPAPRGTITGDQRHGKGHAAARNGMGRAHAEGLALGHALRRGAREVQEAGDDCAGNEWSGVDAARQYP